MLTLSIVLTFILQQSYSCQDLNHTKLCQKLPNSLPAFISDYELPGKEHKESGGEGTRNPITKIFQICFLIESIIIILINLTMMLLIVITSKKLRKKPSIKCFLSLQLTHILLGIVSIANIFEKHQAVWNLITNALLLQMFFSMFLQTIEKLIATSSPFEHYNLTKRKFFNILIFGSWCVSIILPIGLIAKCGMTNKLILCFLTGTISVSFFVLIASNIAVMRIAKKHVKAINKTMVGVHGKVVRKLSKSLVTCVTIVASFLLLWTPFLVHNILCLQKGLKIKMTSPFTFGVIFVAMLNGIADPIILYLFNRDVKIMVRKTTSIRRRDKYVKEFHMTEKENKISVSSLSSIVP